MYYNRDNIINETNIDVNKIKLTKEQAYHLSNTNVNEYIEFDGFGDRALEFKRFKILSNKRIKENSEYSFYSQVLECSNGCFYEKKYRNSRESPDGYHIIECYRDKEEDRCLFKMIKKEIIAYEFITIEDDINGAISNV